MKTAACLTFLAALGLAALGVATVAGAETTSLALAPFAKPAAAPLFTRVEPGTAKPALNLAHPTPVLSYAKRDNRTGFPTTAVSHQFAGDGPVGSVGYLCGIAPFAPDYYGSTAGPATGFERGLTFLGANLRYAFH